MSIPISQFISPPLSPLVSICLFTINIISSGIQPYNKRYEGATIIRLPFYRGGSRGPERVNKLLKSHSSEAKLEFEPNSFTPQPSLTHKYTVLTEVADTSHPHWRPGRAKGWVAASWGKAHHSDFSALMAKSTPQRT